MISQLQTLRVPNTYLLGEALKRERETKTDIENMFLLNK